MSESVRTDKWLWATRLFKTRGLAAKAATEGKVTRGGHPLKPATGLQVGDILEIPFPEGPGRRIIAVTATLQTRVAAPLAQACYEERTDPATYQELREWQNQQRAAGGRPTKRDRREIGRIRGFFD
jgi:ribosome-associated heat shock protein Hsp15